MFVTCKSMFLRFRSPTNLSWWHFQDNFHPQFWNRRLSGASDESFQLVKQHSTILSDTKQYGTIQNDTERYKTIQNNTERYKTIRNDTSKSRQNNDAAILSATLRRHVRFLQQKIQSCSIFAKNKFLKQIKAATANVEMDQSNATIFWATGFLGYCSTE